MGKSFGIAAFVLLLVSVPIPVVGNYLSLLAVLILCLGALHGEKTWTVVVDLLAWVKMFLLSPTWHLMMFGGGYVRGTQNWASKVNRDAGVRDPGLDQLIVGSNSAVSGLNTTTLLFTVAILAAPIVIMIWRSRSTVAATPPRGS